MKIQKIFKCGTEDVYNMTVDEFHNYIVQGGIVSKNCDALRYLTFYWKPKVKIEENKKGRKKWRKDLIEDYRRANSTIKALMIKELGEPIF